VLNDRSNAPISPHPGLWHAHGKVAARQAAGHRRRPAHRQHDGACQVAPDEQDEQYRSHEPDHRRGDGPVGGGIGPVLPFRGEPAFCRPQLIELSAQRVDAAPPLLGRGHAPGRWVASPRRLHHRERVVIHVGVDGSGDGLRPGVLARYAGEPVQVTDRARERSLGGGPRLEELLGAGEQEAPLARLQVDDQPLERAGCHQHPLGVPGELQLVPLVAEGDEQHDEGAADEQREEPTREDHPGREPSTGHKAQ
jgi:hypothetical protein